MLWGHFPRFPREPWTVVHVKLCPAYLVSFVFIFFFINTRINNEKVCDKVFYARMRWKKRYVEEKKCATPVDMHMSGAYPGGDTGDTGPPQAEIF